MGVELGQVLQRYRNPARSTMPAAHPNAAMDNSMHCFASSHSAYVVGAHIAIIDHQRDRRQALASAGSEKPGIQLKTLRVAFVTPNAF
jgi:hypothetical protein